MSIGFPRIGLYTSFYEPKKIVNFDIHDRYTSKIPKIKYCCFTEKIFFMGQISCGN